MGFPGNPVVTGPISVSDAADIYPTHWDVLGFGGHMSVATITDRNNVSTLRRKFGMFVTVYADPTPANNQVYILANTVLGGEDDVITNNDNWIPFTSGSGTTVSFGAAGQIPVTNATTDDFIYEAAFSYDSTNNILKADRFHSSLAAAPSGGVTAGDLYFDSVINDFRVYSSGQWTNITRPGRKVISGVSYLVLEEDRNTIIYVNNTTDAEVPVTVPAGLSDNFQVTFVKLGTANVTFAAGAGATVNATDPTIEVRYAAATLVHRGTDLFVLFGGLGTPGSGGGGSGTVTSIDVSGGTTGLTFSGGPVTTSGTITMAGTLGVPNGGTGLTSLSTGQIPYGNGTGAFSSSSGFVYDASNTRLSVNRILYNAFGSDPSSPTDGELIYNSATADLRARISGQWTNLSRPEIVSETTTARTISNADRNKVIRCTNSGAITITVNSTPATGTAVTIVKAAGSGTITFSGTVEGIASTMTTDNTAVTLIHRGSGTWMAFGALGGGLTFGSAGMIPFMNSSANGFSYDGGFVYDGTNNKLIGGNANTSASGSNSFTWGDNNINNGTFGSAMFGELSEIAAAVGAAFNAGENNYISAYGGHTMGRGVAVTGTYSWAGGWYSPSTLSGKTNLKAVKVSGAASFGFYTTNSSQTDNHGVLADSSAVLGGVNPNIPSDSPRSVILGGNAIKARATDPDQVYVPNFNIVSTPDTATSNYSMLVRDNTTGEVKQIAAGGGGISGLTTPRVPYAASATTLADNANFTFNNSTSVLTVEGFVIGSSSISGTKTISTGSADTNAGLLIQAKGSGSVQLLNSNTSLSISGGRVFMNGSTSNFVFDMAGTTAFLGPSNVSTPVTIFSQAGSVASQDGTNFTIQAGPAYNDSGNGNGGHVIIQSGAKRAAGSGVDGDIQLTPPTGGRVDFKTGAVTAASAASTHKLPIKINGTDFWILVSNVAP